jgi:copper transporter 1
MRLKLVSSGKPLAQIEAPLLQGKTLGGGGMWSVARIGGAVLFGVNSAIAYLLMSAVMSFNGGVFVAVVLVLADLLDPSLRLCPSTARERVLIKKCVNR